jgi:hypothetical protein
MRDANQSTVKRAEAIEFIAIGDPQPYADDLKKLLCTERRISGTVSSFAYT